MPIWVGADDGSVQLVTDPIVGLPAQPWQPGKPVLAAWCGDPNGVPRLVFARTVKPVLTAVPSNASIIDVSWTAASTVAEVTYKLYRDGVLVYDGPGLVFQDKNRMPSTSYVYTLDVWVAGELIHDDITVTATTPAPAAIVLTAPTVGYVQVVLRWNLAVAGWTHKLFRTNTSTTTPIYSGLGDTFTDTGRTHNTSYSYVVKVYDPAGNEAGVSNEVTVTTLAVTASTVTLDSPLWDQMTVSWTQPIAGLTYKVYRTGKTTPIYTGTGSTVTDKLLFPSTSYTYTVKTFQGTVDLNVASAPVSGTTDAYEVPVITLTSTTYENMQIRWTASTEGSVDHYELWRHAPGVEGWTLLESEPAADKARDEGGLAENRTYEYLVRSFRGGKKESGGVQIGGDAVASRTTRTRSWGDAAAGPAPGYSSYGRTSTKVINVSGNNINLPHNCTVTSMKQWVWGYGGNGRVEPKFGGVTFGIGYVIGPGQGWRDFATSIYYSSGEKTSGMRLGGPDWGSTEWTGWVAQNNYVMPGIYPAGSSTGYICTHSVHYWYYPTLDDQPQLVDAPWWDESLAERATHTASWTDAETGEITKVLIKDYLTDEVLVDWER